MGERNERRQGKEAFSGYFFTDAIRERLKQAPHVLVNLPNGKVSVVYGRRREEGDPVFSVFCSIEQNGSIRYTAVGGITRKDALRGIGGNVFAIICDHDTRQRQARREAQRIRRETRQQALKVSQEESSQRQSKAVEDPEVLRMHETGEVPRRLRFWKSDSF